MGHYATIDNCNNIYYNNKVIGFLKGDESILKKISIAVLSVIVVAGTVLGLKAKLFRN